jgi:arabinan endo-1,5-alpha-L-arabinosidase
MALTDNLLAFYKLDDLTDSSGNGNTLTNNGNVSFASGKIGNAAVFDGSHCVSSNCEIPVSTTASISLWVKPNLLDAGRYQTLIGKYSGLNIGIDPSNQIFVDDFTQPLLAGTILTTEFWYHIFTKVDNGISYLYVNGELITSAPNILNTVVDFYIGGEGNISVDYFDGLIDAVGIWNRALSDAEVAALYNNGTGLELGGAAPASSSMVKLIDGVKLFGKTKFVS